MSFQPIPHQVEWVGGGFAILAVAERAWKFTNKVITDCQRRKRLQEKRKARQAARATKRLAAKRVPMPKAAIGIEKFPATRKAQPKRLPGKDKRSSVSDPKNALTEKTLQ